jgi:hypothetical protein
MVHPNSFLRCAGLFVALALVGGFGARAADEPKDKDEESARLEFMSRKLDEFTLTTAKEPDKPLTRLKDPVQKYTNPVRNGSSHGALFLWMSGERPVAVGTVWIGGEGDAHREFTTLTDQALVCKRNGKDIWTPKGDGVVRKPLPDAPKPAGTAPLRLVQMRRQAERFTADFEVRAVKGKEELRLMPQPLRQYTADNGAVEGAIFALAHNNDPELLVILELANPAGGKPVWSYTPVRCSSVRMRLRLDDKEVWEVDYYWTNPRVPTDLYMEAGDGRYPAPEAKPKPKR